MGYDDVEDITISRLLFVDKKDTCFGGGVFLPIIINGLLLPFVMPLKDFNRILKLTSRQKLKDKWKPPSIHKKSSVK